MLGEMHKNDSNRQQITSLNKKMDEISRSFNLFDSRMKSLVNICFD